MPRTLLVSGGGAGLRRTADRAQALGLRVVAAVGDDSGGDVPSVTAERVDVADVAGIAELAARHQASGILAVDRDAVAAAAVAARRVGLPALPAATTSALGSRIALRRQLGLAGVAQPRFAAVRTVHEGRVGLGAVGLPAVLKPAQPRPGAGVHVLESADDLEARLYRALAASTSEEAIVESLHEGASVEVACVVRNREVHVVAVLDRVDAELATRVYPSTLFGDVLERVEETARHALHALALEDGVASVEIAVGDTGPVAVEALTWTPDDVTDALVRHAVGVDLLELAIRIALRVDVPDPLIRARFHRPAALRRVTNGHGAERFAGVAEHGPGYVVVEAATNLEALERVAAGR